MRLIYLIILVLLQLILQLRSVHAQLNRYEPDLDLKDLSIYQWTAKDGLSSNNITSVFQDSRGLLWVTSFNGVMIYDTERIDIYDKDDFPFLDNDGFHVVTETSDSTILLGSQGNGIIAYKHGQFEQFAVSEGVAPKSVRCFLIDPDGSIYVGTDNQGAIRIEGNKGTQVLPEEAVHVTVRDVCQNQRGDIWIGTEGLGLYGIVNDTIMHFGIHNGLHSNTINALEADSLGRILIGNNGGYQLIDQEYQLQSFDELKGIYVNSLMMDTSMSVWLGSELGIFRFHEQTRTLRRLNSKRGVDMVRVSDIMMDREGSIWMSSNRSGLIRFKESLVTTIMKPTISSDRTFLVYESWDGNRYIATDQAALDVCDSDCDRLEIKSNLYDNGVRDIFHDQSDSSFWLATYGGVVHILKDGRETNYTIKNGMPANNFRLVHKDALGNLWFASRSGGLVKFRDGEVLEIYGVDNKLESSFILSLAESQTGDLYIGTHSGGLSIMDQKGEVRTFHLKEDDAGVLFFNVDLRDDGTALITSTIGLVYFDGQKLSLVHMKTDPISRTFFDVLRDDWGNIWVTSNKGVLRISQSDFGTYLDGTVKELNYQVFDENDGMFNEECTGATRATKLKDGRIMVPTLGGVCVLDPKKLEMNRKTPDVIIRNLIADQKVHYHQTGKKIEVEAGAKRLTFQFAALSYLSPDRNYYRYRLEGFDPDWSGATILGEIEYTNLPPGNYQFQVMASNDGENWSEDIALMDFRVQPFFYETIWFYVVVIVAMLLLVWVVYEWRLSFINRQNKELKKVNEELDRFVYSASHEMRSPLSSILGLVQIARQDDSSEVRTYLEHIESSVMRLDDFIKDIIDYSRNARLGVIGQVIDLRAMVDSVLHSISFTENYGKIRLIIEIEDRLSFCSDEGRVKIVLSNLIANAYKHHEPENREDPWVKVEVKKAEGGISIEVADNGPGISEKHHQEIFKMFYRANTTTEGSGLGLYMVREIAQKLDGKLTMHSVLNQGTSFSLYLLDMKGSKEGQ